MKFEVKESSDTKTIKELFVEYSHIKGVRLRTFNMYGLEN